MIRIEAELPDDMQALIAALREDTAAQDGKARR
jgi:hypothetical protein